MRISHTTDQELEQALAKVNKKYDQNIMWNRFDHVSTSCFKVTLKCKDSLKAGHRLGQCLKNDGTHRRLINACWHVHGDFFDALFEICPKAIVYSGTQKITVDSGNWEDRDIGSMMNPLYFSEACDC